MQLEFFRKEFGLDKDTVLDKLESVSGEWMDLLALLSIYVLYLVISTFTLGKGFGLDT